MKANLSERRPGPPAKGIRVARNFGGTGSEIDNEDGLRSRSWEDFSDPFGDGFRSCRADTTYSTSAAPLLVLPTPP